MNKIVISKKTGKLLSAIFDDKDLSKTSADLEGELVMENNQLKLLLKICLNEKFEIIFKEREEK